MDPVVGVLMDVQIQFTQAVTRNLHHEVAEQIGLRIVSREIAPGAKLPPELRLCEMLHVSRTAVREAIRVLVGKGLLEAKRRSGTQVRAPEHWNHLDADVLRWQMEAADTRELLIKLFQVRFAVEPAAAALAAEHASDAGISRISQAFTAMKASESAQAFAEADLEFHRSIFMACGNEYFLPMLQMLSMALRKSFEISAPGDHRARAVAEHGRLFDAIAQRNPTAARRVALELLDHSQADLSAILGTDVDA
jgi:DNA-binding FadR family transcriptional regulator